MSGVKKLYIGDIVKFISNDIWSSNNGMHCLEPYDAFKGQRHFRICLQMKIKYSHIGGFKEEDLVLYE